MEMATWAAHCPKCARRYRVQSVDRAHACKQCGTTLVVNSADPSPAARAVTPPTTPTEPPKQRLPVLSEEPAPGVRERAERDKVERELRDGRSWITPLTCWLILGAALHATLTVMALLDSGAAGPSLFDVSGNAFLTAAFLVAAIMLRHQPFLSALPLAISEVAWVAIDAVRGRPIDVRHVVWTLSIVLATAQMWRVQKFMREHPTTLGARMFTGVTSKRGRKATSSEMAGLRSNAQQRSMMWSGVAVAFVAIATFVGYRVIHPTALTPFDAVGKSFEAAWTSSEANALEDFWPTDAAESRANLHAELELRGWLATRPAPRTSSFKEQRGKIAYELEIPGGSVLATWTGKTGAWRLEHIELPLPLIQPFANEFMARWNAGKFDDVAKFFEDAEVEKQRAALTRVVERQHWNEKPPKISDWSEKSGGRNRIEVTFASEAGPMIAACLLVKNGVWQLRSIRFPS